ncbi:MAG: endonuclease/exonuclease/phosphatase family protein [Bacteroidota bacterium]|nr:endonuclease/exonuclease/phosphatase family protein [Bacteroidota bacterium]
MKTFLLIFAGLLCLITLITLVNKEYWWIRIFDYPRLQAVIVGVITGVALLYFSWKPDTLSSVVLLVLAGSILYQFGRIFPYTPMHKVQVVPVDKPDLQSRISLLVANVKQDNKESDPILQLIQTKNPDVVLLMETDKSWAEQVSVLKQTYPHTIEQPQGNSFGIMLFSKFELVGGQVNFLVEKHIPSIYTQIKLPSGDLIDFYGLHPEPPKVNNHTDERDAELLIVGKMVKKSGKPSIVAGDLNDVGWSHTSILFRQISGLMDPRIGRGHYNTYNANIPFFRYPLDYVFMSGSFQLVSLSKLGKIGSDHFPMYIMLQYVPGDKHENNVPEPTGNDHEEADKKIENGTD